MARSNSGVFSSVKGRLETYSSRRYASIRYCTFSSRRFAARSRAPSCRSSTFQPIATAAAPIKAATRATADERRTSVVMTVANVPESKDLRSTIPHKASWSFAESGISCSQSLSARRRLPTGSLSNATNLSSGGGSRFAIRDPEPRWATKPQVGPEPAGRDHYAQGLAFRCARRVSRTLRLRGTTLWGRRQGTRLGLQLRGGWQTCHWGGSEPPGTTDPQ